MLSIMITTFIWLTLSDSSLGGGGGGVFPYSGYIGMCSLVLNWVCFLEESTSSSLGDKSLRKPIISDLK